MIIGQIYSLKENDIFFHEISPGFSAVSGTFVKFVFHADDITPEIQTYVDGQSLDLEPDDFKMNHSVGLWLVIYKEHNGEMGHGFIEKHSPVVISRHGA